MKILLINTNRMRPAIAPIGLDYLADSLIAEGHEPELLDLCFSEDIAADVESCVRGFSPDCVGITVRNTDDCYFSGRAFFLPEIKQIVDHVRRCSDAPVVMGGVGFSVAPESVMTFCEPDYGIAGEGEEALVGLLSALETGRGLEEVSKPLLRDGDSVRRNPEAHSHLDLLPSRQRSLPDNSRYYREGGQAGIETKRGCGMDCIFCADPVSKGRRVRLRSPVLVVEEIKTLLAQGISHLHTCDCEFNLPGEHAKDVCRAIIDAGLGERIRWYAYCSILPFDEEMADLFVRAGCGGIDFGADSGSDRILRGLGRNFTALDLARTVSFATVLESRSCMIYFSEGPGRPAKPSASPWT